MGRRENPVAGDGPQRELAEELRRLRDKSGLTLRQLANRSGYSRATLSAAASGRTLPTLDVTLAYAIACGGDTGEWTQLWHHTAAAVGSATPSAEPPPGTEAHASPAVPQDPTVLVDDPSPAPLPGARRHVAALALVGALVALTGGFAVLHFWPPTGQAKATNPVAVTRRIPAPDGADPDDAGCSADAVTVARANIALPVNLVLGQILLRYSAACQASWARFEPTPVLENFPLTHITIVTSRPADHASQPYTMPYEHTFMWGNVLRADQYCVQATASLDLGTPTPTPPIPNLPTSQHNLSAQAATACVTEDHVDTHVDTRVDTH